MMNVMMVYQLCSSVKMNECCSNVYLVLVGLILELGEVYVRVMSRLRRTRRSSRQHSPISARKMITNSIKRQGQKFCPTQSSAQYPKLSASYLFNSLHNP